MRYIKERSKDSKTRDRQLARCFVDQVPQASDLVPKTEEVGQPTSSSHSTQSRTRHTAFSEVVRIRLIPRARDTPDVYYRERKEKEHKNRPRRRVDQEEELENQEDDSCPAPCQEDSATEQTSPLSCCEDMLNESSPIKTVPVPSIKPNDSPPLGAVYENDPAVSCQRPGYRSPSPEIEMYNRRHYVPKPGLATPWERNEDRSRRRLAEHRHPTGVTVSPNEYVAPLENWFRTPGHVIKKLLQRRREALLAPPWASSSGEDSDKDDGTGSPFKYPVFINENGLSVEWGPDWVAGEGPSTSSATQQTVSSDEDELNKENVAQDQRPERANEEGVEFISWDDVPDRDNGQDLTAVSGPDSPKSDTNDTSCCSSAESSPVSSTSGRFPVKRCHRRSHQARPKKHRKLSFDTNQASQDVPDLE